MPHILYGDGIHDDTAAIQELIDSSMEVSLPAPKAFYLISKPLELHGNLRLKLPRYAEIRLADGANCYMLKNVTVDDAKPRRSPWLQCSGASANRRALTRPACGVILSAIE